MQRNQLAQTLNSFLRVLGECKHLATDADHWSTPGSQPHITKSRADSITELAFLRAYIAWETFLEESFILYLMGKTAPRERPPVSYMIPLQRKVVEELVIPEGRRFAFWDEITVMGRSERFFKNGYPFGPAVRARQSTFEEMRKIRNATAHGSNDCWEKFKSVVRTKLSIVPARVTVGGFLGTTLPGVTPPQSILDSYLEILENTAKQIVSA